MIWSVAGASTLTVAALGEAPVAVQFWAGGVSEASFDVCPAWESMPLDVAARYAVSDALEAECVYQPLKKISRVVLFNGYSNRKISHQRVKWSPPSSKWQTQDHSCRHARSSEPSLTVMASLPLCQFTNVLFTKSDLRTDELFMANKNKIEDHTTMLNYVERFA